MNSIPQLSFAPSSGPGERQQPRKFFIFLGVLMLIFSAFFIFMGISATAAGDSGAILPLILFGSLFGGIGILLILMRTKGYYQEFDDHFEFRVYPRAAASVRYADISSATFQASRGQRFAYVKNRAGKNHMIDLRSFKAPRLAAYLMTNAAQYLPPQQFEQELTYLASGFGIKLNQADVDTLWHINNQKFGQQFGGPAGNQQPFGNQQFDNPSGNAFGPR